MLCFFAVTTPDTWAVLLFLNSWEQMSEQAKAKSARLLSKASLDDDSGYDLAGPRAEAMFESLRSFGYDLQTAIADLIDNSITARARNIWIHFHWDGEHSAITVCDDGLGMSEAELIEAMRPVSRSPVEAREPNDLGRFGLGLKTASFSQCRLLTVRTRQQRQPPVTRCWDLDYVARIKDWRLLRKAPDGAEEHLQQLNQMKSGTIVLWQKMDRLVGKTKSDDAVAHQHFLERIDHVKDHLAMVFHDYMQGPRSIKIWINGNPVEPWDPFLINHPATQRLPVENMPIAGRNVTVTPFILPHHSKLDSESHAASAGPRGWNAHQGFYIYRNRRLLVAGNWLGLGFQKEEHYKLARIRVDVPAELDDQWQIDVLKSRAHPPSSLRGPMKRVARLTRNVASEIYRHRGARLTPAGSGERVFPWEQRVRHSKIYYSINRNHPLVQDVLQSSSDENKIRALLRLLEETVPVPLISINNSERPNHHAAPFEGAASRDVVSVIIQVYHSLRNGGYTSAEAKARLKTLEPFQAFPEVIASVDELEEE